jgi:group I intron endonuclease
MQVIYRLTSPTGKVYIGQTKNLSERLSSYRNYKCKAQKKLYSSLVKHGFDKHELYIIHKFPDTVNQTLIDNYEIYAIEMHKIMGLELLNITDGGCGFKGMKPSETNRQAILKATQGEKHKLSKMTAQQIISIRAFYIKGIRGRGIRQIANKYNISMRLAYNIVNNKTWKHV